MELINIQELSNEDINIGKQMCKYYNKWENPINSTV